MAGRFPLISWVCILVGTLTLLAWLHSLKNHRLFSIRRMRSLPPNIVQKPEDYAKLTALLVLAAGLSLVLGGIAGTMGAAAGPYIGVGVNIITALLGGRLDKNLITGTPPEK